jgi:hypothetical protein
LPRGIADTSKIQIDWDTGQNDPKTGKPLTIKKDVHRVQILDPATGTGTFLAEAIKQIAAQVKDIAPGMWSGYVEENLIPRLHGFELLMASYAMCHLKLDMMLTELGYKPSSTPPRLGVYLTNSLEEGERVEQTLPFARWLSEEAKGANTIKRDTPIMCVIGNPPYSARTLNRGQWISNLIDIYKQNLTEKKINLDDDYIKFIRFGQYLIERKQSGVLAYITNSSFLEGVTHRSMRRDLLRAFDKIYILDLHGDSKQNSVSSENTDDRNVFDIMQGVSIAVFIKTSMSDAPASVLHSEIWGDRNKKNEYLWEAGIRQSDFIALQPVEPYNFFVPMSFDEKERYDSGFLIGELCIEGGIGAKTERDRVSIHHDAQGIKQAVHDFENESVEFLRQRYSLEKDSRDWSVAGAKADIIAHKGKSEFARIAYKPFDIRFTYYTGSTRGFMGTPGRKTVRQFVKKKCGYRGQ